MKKETLTYSIVLLLALVSSNSYALFSNKIHSPCEFAFIKAFNNSTFEAAKVTASINPNLSLWDERFDTEILLNRYRLMQQTDREILLNNLGDLAASNHVTYLDNLGILASRLREEKLVSDLFLNRTLFKNSGKDFFVSFSKGKKQFFLKPNVDSEKLVIVESLVKRYSLGKTAQKEYRDILLGSKITSNELDLLIDSKMTLRQKRRDIDRFRDYLDYFDNLKPSQRKKALKQIDEIYNYSYTAKIQTVLPTDSLLTKFYKQELMFEKKLMQDAKDTAFNLKLQDDAETLKQLGVVVDESKSTGIIDKIKISKIKKRFNKKQIKPSLWERAKRMAKGKSRVYRRLYNGCNSGSSKRLASAKKKFKRFKMAMTLTTTPYFYWKKNKDKMDTDEFWWERLGVEMSLGIMYTFVGNKIMTNTNSTFWGKYLEGWVKFRGVDIISNGAYGSLFGKHSYIRYFQKFYKDDVGLSSVEQEFEKLKESPEFAKDKEKLINFLEKKSGESNLKNMLNKYFNLGAYDSSADYDRITQEDLETEEGREVFLELLAEKMYLDNMGDWPMMQTGSQGGDRWLFYASRNVLFDMKSIALNLTIFNLMCREPLGPATWGLILGLVIGDNYVFGDLTYGLRREAINQ